jgi:hypothetical protein
MQRKASLRKEDDMLAPKTTLIPAALATDPSDLVDALEVARNLWGKGETADAIRWVRRAVEAADDAGNFERMGALARVAAELTDQTIARSNPPPVPTSQVRLSSRGPKESAAPPSPRAASKPPPLPPSRPPPLPARASTNPPASRATPATIGQRVSVRTSVRDDGILVVRLLRDGESAPPGTREAMLVMADAEERR